MMQYDPVLDLRFPSTVRHDAENMSSFSGVLFLA